MNLMIDGKDNVEFNEIIKVYNTKGMEKCFQYFVITMTYNLITSHSEELKIIDLADDQLEHLHHVQKEHVEEWLNNYLK